MTTATTKIECEIVLMMDEDGNFFVCKADDDICEKVGDHGGEYGTLQMRRLDLKVMMTPPKALEGTLDVPDEAGTEFKAEIAA